MSDRPPVPSIPSSIYPPPKGQFTAKGFDGVSRRREKRKKVKK